MNLHKYYETVMQLTHGIVVTLDLEGRIIHGNSELEFLSGYTMQELAGRDWFETFIPKKDRTAARHAITESFQDHEISAFAGVISASDGDTVYVNWNLKPLTDSNGEVISLLCVGQDVTNLILREKGLLRERYSLIERNRELDCLYKISQIMTSMKPKLSAMLDQVVHLLPHAFKDPSRTHVRLSLDGDIWQTRGRPGDVHTFSEPITVNEDHRGMLTVSVNNDEINPSPAMLRHKKGFLVMVTKQIAILVGKKETRRAKLTLESQLRQADRLAKIGQFSAGVAHEINEPLANILGFAQLALQTPKLPDQTTNDLGNIVDSSLHAREIIRKLMFFSRQFPPQKISVNLNELVDQALHITSANAKRSKVTIKREFDDALPHIMADPQHIKQVVVNLAANAIQAMPDGGTLTARTVDKGDVYLIVEDTGSGMAQETLKQMFSPFYTTKDVDKGTGLGLSVVHGIIKAHNGFIQVNSVLDKGTQVEIAFPSQRNTTVYP
ncbi:PAS domain S-box protein [Pseudodesulfovibrio sp. JC047]|uniref:PAS domain-containing sensor histidine kinase n=1 Tax=Pseudodesulfovibrio sp. JC047 TaxID=2683199 RepID=UPI0013D5BF44|nr:ATP-binding protein [Pseudodesulfovibrio sp. JC047]NDV18506.1 PAS domain S-box protein [Pseudodesulfovibrio sp. JC047]